MGRRQAYGAVRRKMQRRRAGTLRFDSRHSVSRGPCCRMPGVSGTTPARLASSREDTAMRLSSFLAATVTTLSLVACGGDDGGGGNIDAADVLENPGFPVPTATTKANTETGGQWMEVGEA